jgi:hypothetical protein
MPARIALRTDFTAADLRKLAVKSSNVNQSRRLLSLATVRDGMRRGLVGDGAVNAEGLGFAVQCPGSGRAA